MLVHQARSLYHLGVAAAVIYLRSGRSVLLTAGFWGMQVITVSLALSRLCDYFMDCLATASHLFSIHIVCCCFKVFPSSVTVSCILSQ